MVSEEIKLHLGCGKRHIPSFIHIDLDNLPHIDYQQDISQLPMFEDNSADLIYACHVLEHFKRNEVENVLAEWHRILKYQGILRLSVPNFEAIVKVYDDYKDIELIMGLLYGGQDNDYNFHHVVFDFKNLEKYLKNVGFKEVRKYDWRQTIHRDYDDFSQSYIPHMDKKNGFLVSLNVEAVK